MGTPSSEQSASIAPAECCRPCERRRGSSKGRMGAGEKGEARRGQEGLSSSCSVVVCYGK